MSMQQSLDSATDLKNHLLKQKHEILASLHEAANESLQADEPFFADAIDQASAVSDKTLSLKIRDYHHSALRQIDQALRRMHEGSFGICESCAGEIAPARLKANPATTLCIECKAELESERHRFAADVST